MTINLLIIQNAKGQPKNGVILQKEQVDDLICYDNKYNIDIFPEIHFENPSGMHHLANMCFSKMNTTSFNIFLGGDHYTSFGTILASLMKHKNQFKLLWIDAHADIHSWETTPSRNMHGMPAYFLMTHSFENIPRLLPEQILYIGLRSVEQAEWNFIHSQGIRYITAEEFLSNPEKSYQQIQNFVQDSPLHISFDVDSLDPSIMPSTGTSISGGLLMDHFNHIVEDARNHASSFYAIDIMEYNPTIGTIEDQDISKHSMQLLFTSISK